MILIISGTNRPNNYSRKMALQMQKMLEQGGQDSKVLSLEDLPSDMPVSDMFGNRSPVMKNVIKTLITPAKALMIVAPEYNGSYPGILKVFLESLSDDDDWKIMEGRSVMLVGVSAGRAGNLRGLDHLTSVLHYMGLPVFHEKLALPGIVKILSEDGAWIDQRSKAVLQRRMDAFILSLK
ncbi:MAG: hypothetical protein GWO77_06325 [Bacteroidetes bacterium]|jgi:NAD(P)H-dependent FMN reductase|nr:NAD(P)H-dependent oxidoreductase [Flavobacteriales bacterium]NCF58100.1 hypothetical protein [Bacteroidota bacterium]NCG43614.1 hypothetical protein [Pseudomonadota bacterium]MBT3740454.1 NAD(P)H-dependent oxidoreductase [Flavobacteriales bacterium]MBT4528576.1 NAD(P)H-dependent oxidoreductase [Flavobacteriales bacterium]